MPKSDGFRGITMEKYTKHVMNFKDPVFRCHRTFPYIIENYMHRINVIHTFRGIYISKQFEKSAVDIGELTKDDLLAVCRHYDKCRLVGENPSLGNSVCAGRVKKLLGSLRTYGGRVAGTQYERQRCKYEIYATVYHYGMPHLFVTWNPADVHSTMVVNFGNREIPLISYDDIDGIVPNSVVRAALVAKDPASVAEFFHKLIRTAMHCFFGWIIDSDNNAE